MIHSKHINEYVSEHDVRTYNHNSLQTKHKCPCIRRRHLFDILRHIHCIGSSKRVWRNCTNKTSTEYQKLNQNMKGSTQTMKCAVI